MKNLTALVTGASKGIGFQIVKMLCDDDRFSTIHCVSRTKTPLEHHKIKSHCIDISNYESTAYHLRKILGDKPLHVLINCAGICNQSLFKDIDFADIQREININLTGTIGVTHAVLQNMIPGSHIIIVSSLMGRVAAPTYSTYCATKFALVGFSESLRCERESKGINVSCVLPTLVNTDMTADKEALNDLYWTIPPQTCAKEIVKLIFKHNGLKSIGVQAKVACLSERLSPFVKRFMF